MKGWAGIFAMIVWMLFSFLQMRRANRYKDLLIKSNKQIDRCIKVAQDSNKMTKEFEKLYNGSVKRMSKCKR